MKLLFLVPFTFLNNPHNICKNCENFIVIDNSACCKLYGDVDIISGKIYYNHCSIARKDQNKCDIEGKHYKRYKPFRYLEENGVETNRNIDR